LCDKCSFGKTIAKRNPLWDSSGGSFSELLHREDIFEYFAWLTGRSLIGSHHKHDFQRGKQRFRSAQGDAPKMKLAHLLNPVLEEQPQDKMTSERTTRVNFSNHTVGLHRARKPKAQMRKGRLVPDGETRYPPSCSVSQEVLQQQSLLKIWPKPEEMARYSRHIPYSSDKLMFNATSGRNGVTGEEDASRATIGLQKLMNDHSFPVSILHGGIGC